VAARRLQGPAALRKQMRNRILLAKAKITRRKKLIRKRIVNLEMRKQPTLVGMFAYFGLLDGILLHSAGNTKWHEHLRGMRMAFLLQPSLFNEETRQCIKSRGSIALDDNWSELVEQMELENAQHRAPPPRTTQFLIDFHSDGVELNTKSSSSSSCYPLLATVSAMVDECSGEKFILHKMPPFIVGLFIGEFNYVQTLFQSFY
jgi:hypothetical protein